MTRRGVIAALATAAGAVQAEQRVKWGDASMIHLPDKVPLHVQLGKGDSIQSPGFDPIIVKMGNETVTLTAREIMDALLPPKPNHCPVCGQQAPPPSLPIPLSTSEWCVRI
jgi:hypothetical protein